MNKTNKTTRNPKKIRRAVKERENRQLTVEEMLRLYSAAIEAGAPVTAQRVISMRGGISVAEAEMLVALTNIEAASNGSTVRVGMKIQG